MEYVRKKRVNISIISETHLGHISLLYRTYIFGVVIHRLGGFDDRCYRGAALVIRSSIQYRFQPSCSTRKSTQIVTAADKISELSYYVAAIVHQGSADFSNLLSSLENHFLYEGASLQSIHSGFTPHTLAEKLSCNLSHSVKFMQFIYSK